MRKTRTSIAVAGATLLSLVMAGCSGGGAAAPAATGQKSNVTLTISRFSGPAADAEVKVLKDFTNQTGIQVRVDATDIAQLQQKQTLAAQNKTGDYDLLYVKPDWYPLYISSNYLLPLTDDLKANPDVNVEDFNQLAVSLLKNSDGTVFGLPDYFATQVFVYNKQVFAENGQTVPKNWADLLAVSTYFKNKGTGIALPGSNGNAMNDIVDQWANGLGGNYVDDKGKLTLTTKPVQDSAVYATKLMKQSLTGSVGWAWDQTQKAIQFGTAPLGISITGLVGLGEDPSQSTVAGKLGYAPVPSDGHVSGTLSTWNYSIPQGTKHPKEAFQLLKWLTSAETQKKDIQTFPGWVSLRASVNADTSLSASSPWLPVCNEVLKNPTLLVRSTSGPALTTALGAGFNGVFANGTDPIAMLQQVQTQLEGKF
jgi:multiple sugar transport system substrate-binding protein